VLLYGFTNAWVRRFSRCLRVFRGRGFAIGVLSAKHGLDLDLLSVERFCYLGSTLPFADLRDLTFNFLREAPFVGLATWKFLLGIPLQIGYALSVCLLIAIVWHGIVAISRFRKRYFNGFG